MKTKQDKALMGTGLITAIAASLCCITPVLALVAGTSGMAASFSWMEPFRPYLIGLTVAVLAFAWYQKLKPRTAEDIRCDCGEDDLPAGKAGNRPFMQTKTFLGIVTLFAALMLAFPYYSSVFYTDNSRKTVYVNPLNIQTIDLKIKGMTCDGCESHVAHAAQEVNGVVRAEADYVTGTATVKFDNTKTTKEEVVESINETSYKVVGFIKDNKRLNKQAK